MVSGSRIEGGTQTLSADVRETIQSIKEVVGNHSDADIYVVLEESNMDPHESVQKLLFQDPFHVVKRRKDKKKEALKGSSEPRKMAEQNTTFKGSSEPRRLPVQNTSFKGSSEPRKFTEHAQGIRSNAFSVRNARRTAYTRNSLPGISRAREFRVVRDNRVNKNPAIVQSSTSASVPGPANVPGKSPIRNSDQKHTSPKHSEGLRSSQSINGPSDMGRGQFKDANSNIANRKGVLEESRPKVTNPVSPLQAMKSHSSQPSTTSAMNNTVVGLYSSSSDPVHVPSNSRSSGAVGAIRREVGVVGIRRQSSDNSTKHSAVPSTSVSASIPSKDISSSAELHHPSGSATKNDPLVLTPVSESAAASTALAKSFTINQYGGKPHQQPMGHQKAPQHNMEWKPKSSQKSSFISPVVIRTSANPVPSPNYNSTDSKKETENLQEKLSQVTVSENEHVFIPQHLRVPEADRTQLTFGSFGMEADSTKNFSSGFQGLENQQQQFSSDRSPSTSSEDVNQVDLPNGQVRNSGSASPASTTGSEQPSPDKKESLSPGNLESYVDIGTVRNDSPSYTPAEPQQRQDPQLPNFAAYDPQAGYDMQFYRPLTDESARGQGVPAPGEVLSSHVANNIPGSSVAMVQQQTVPQLYPQVHVSHFPSFMQYRQFISPVYVPPMGVPGYSGNPGYPHPSNGNSYLLMPGGSSHLAAGGLKYGSSQYKPIPAGTPTAYGNFSNPTGYAFNTQGAVGGATSLDDSTRMKYKDGNLFVPNPQAETSEIWIQTPREIPGLPSAPYYNIPGQPPHPAFLPPHTGHASFNGAATAQPTHVQFSGLYHPQQQAAIANPHHLVPNMGSNVGVGAAAPAPGTQIGAYQAPQIGHMNWNTSF